MAIVIHKIKGHFYAYEHSKINGKVVCIYLYPVSSGKPIKVVKVDPSTSEYKGMNKKAAEELKIPFPYPENTIVVDKGDRKEEIRTMRHEIAELEEYKKGKHYPAAHSYALKVEKG